MQHCLKIQDSAKLLVFNVQVICQEIGRLAGMVAYRLECLAVNVHE